MGGKVSLLLMLGFSAIFALMAKDLLNFSNTASENFYNYYTGTKAHNIAVSGANMAANKLFLNKSWTAGFDNLSIDNGNLNVTVEAFQTYKRRIYSIGTYDKMSDTVIVTLEPKNFAQYGNFYDENNAWWATGDTLRGPFHTNDYLKCYGKPIFLGYATTKKGVKLYNSRAHPEFNGGLESGVYVPLEFDTSLIRIAAYDNGHIFRDTTGRNKIIDVKLKLKDNGNIAYKLNINRAGWSSEVTVPLNTLAPNGVIYVEKGNVYVEGTLNGQLSIVATRKGSSQAGKIHITDDIKYNLNPRSNPESTDMLGLIAEQNVQLDFDASRGDIDIQASIYSQRDGLVIENYSNYPGAHNMNLLGGIIGKKLRATARYGWNGHDYYVTHGYSYVHTFDERFFNTVPPFFPKTKYFKIVSWLE
ncbi:hypothetical protein BMS3Abin03_00652 [bacterium BMS3Abin03]|nr:hypothetical protein BMS3Abin03_00652 [bacterium BMS3Abin03]